MASYRSFKKRLLRDKETKKVYDELGPEFELLQMILQKRLEHGLTQKELARKIGTKQSAISRLERGTYNPTVAFLRKIAAALNTELHISFATPQN